MQHAYLVVPYAFRSILKQKKGDHMPQIEIFKPGTFSAMSGDRITFSERELAACANAYDTKVLQAPLVIGHPEHDDPAYGQVKNLIMLNNRLVAITENIEPQFAEMVRNKRFNRVSASFYTPDSKNNPKPGNYYLKHVGFLGAATPALKGLKAPAFKETETNTITVEFSEAGEISPEYLAEKAQQYQDEQAKLGRNISFIECVETVYKGVTI